MMRLNMTIALWNDWDSVIPHGNRWYVHHRNAHLKRAFVSVRLEGDHETVIASVKNT